MRHVYNYWILFLFVLLENLTFSISAPFQFAIAVLEYIFLLCTYIKNSKLGIMYFVSFTLLCYGYDNYDAFEQLPMNFWGIRVGFSLNILFAFVFSTFFLFKKRIYTLSKNSSFWIFLFLFIWGIVRGGFCVLSGCVYGDNYLTDILRYLPAFFFIVLLLSLSADNALLIIKKVIVVSAVSTLVAWLFSARMQYGVEEYTAMSAFNFILPVCVCLFFKMYSPLLRVILILITFIPIFCGITFISGKSIILFFILLVWFLIKYNRFGGVTYFILLLLLINMNYILTIGVEYFSEISPNTAFKFSQISNVFDTDITLLVADTSSMGNLIAELWTVFEYVRHNFLTCFVGDGFGAGVPDILGYLSPFVYNGGYSELCLARNNFYGMHLPLTELFLKFGLIGLCGYIYILKKNFSMTNVSLFVFSILLFLTFYVSKEHFLLALLFYKVGVSGISIVKNKQL